MAKVAVVRAAIKEELATLRRTSEALAELDKRLAANPDSAGSVGNALPQHAASLEASAARLRTVVAS